MGTTTEREGEDRVAGIEEKEPDYPSEKYAWFVVGILMIVYVFSFMDRQILSLLVGPIKEDLGINDTQMSYLMGFSFAVFYTLFGLPMGRLADSKSRRTLIAVGLTVWSFMSAGCGLARTYLQLLAMRIGVGVGEATLSPSAYSLISDYFRPKKLALAISVYGTGIYLGGGMANVLGAMVVQYAAGAEDYVVPVIDFALRPWQLVFFIIGLPGLLFVPVIFAIKEPARRGIKKIKAADGTFHAPAMPLSEVVNYMRFNRGTVLCHTVGFALLSFIGYGAAAWIPTFFVRTYGWERASAGYAYGFSGMVFGTAGIIFGGRFAQWLAEKGYKDSKMRAGVIAAALHIPLAVLFPLMPTGWSALMVLWPAMFTLAMPFGNAPAAIQEMMPNRMRAQASSVYLFVVNIIGLGIGPTAVALCTDYVFGDDGALRYSLVIIGTTGNVLAALLLWRGLALFRGSMTVLHDWQGAETQEERDRVVSPGTAGRFELEYFVPLAFFAVLVGLAFSSHPAAKEFTTVCALLFVVTFVPNAIWIPIRKGLSRAFTVPTMLGLVGVLAYGVLRIANPENYDTLVLGAYGVTLAGVAVYCIQILMPAKQATRG